MKLYRRLAMSLAIMALLPVNAYAMANEDKKESPEKPFYVGVFGGRLFSPRHAHPDFQRIAWH